MVQAGEEWKMSKDEISFYFTLGMNLAYLFKADKDEELPEEEKSTGDE